MRVHPRRLRRYTLHVQTRSALLQHEQVTALPLIKQADENDKDWLR